MVEKTAIKMELVSKILRFTHIFLFSPLCIIGQTLSSYLPKLGYKDYVYQRAFSQGILVYRPVKNAKIDLHYCYLQKRANTESQK